MQGVMEVDLLQMVPPNMQPLCPDTTTNSKDHLFLHLGQEEPDIGVESTNFNDAEMEGSFQYQKQNQIEIERTTIYFQV